MLKFTKQSVIAFDFKEALALRAKPVPMRSMPWCAPPTFSAKADIEPEHALAARIDYGSLLPT